MELYHESRSPSIPQWPGVDYQQRCLDDPFWLKFILGSENWVPPTALIAGSTVEVVLKYFGLQGPQHDPLQVRVFP